MMYWSGEWNAWAWFAMTVSMLVFWVLVGLAVWSLVRRSPRREPEGRAETPLEILRWRYARGDIDDAEFERRQRRLHDTRAS